MTLLPSTRKLLKAVLNFAEDKKTKLYIVGGFLRDIFLKRETGVLDIDFCLKSGAICFGKKLAKAIGAGFVVLDKKHGACRLIKVTRNKTYTLDFTDFRGRDLEDDLLHRDFTVNTLALELKKIFAAGDWRSFLIDPYGGRQDLASGLIKAVNKRAFDEDGLRTLRAFSFACIFGFRIDQRTLRLIEAKRNKLSGVSGERIRDELFKILDTPRAFKYLEQLDKLKILEIIFPEVKMMRRVKQGPYHHLDVWRHSKEAFRQLESLINELDNNQEVRGYLSEVISPQRRRRALIKLGVLLHDIGKPKTKRYKEGKTTFYGHERAGFEIAKNILRRLRLSNDERVSFEKMVALHLRPGYLADNEIVTRRAKFRYFRDAGTEAVSVLLISLADQRATRGRLTTKVSRLQHERVAFGLIREYFKKKREKKMVRLINGDDLIRKFKLKPSPLIGKILREIEELQAIGKLKTKGGALKIAVKFIK